MGTGYRGVSKYSESSIRINFVYLGKRWYEIIKGTPSDTNLEKVAQLREDILAEIKLGIFTYELTFPDSYKNIQKSNDLLGRNSNKLTTGEYLLTWHEYNARSLEETSKSENLRIIHTSLLPDLGHIPLADLSWPDIKAMALNWHNTTKTIRNKLAPLRKALRHALDDGLIESNVLLGKSVDGIQKDFNPEEEEISPFDMRERQALLDACVHQQDHNLFKFIMWTGLRTSEVVSLTWSDIDWHKGTARINKAKPRKATHIKRPKTKAGVRQVKLFPDALQALEAQKDHTLLVGDQIFNNPNTKEPWNGDGAIREHFRVICRNAKVRYRRPYQLRHSYATMMLMAGEPVRWLSKQMGHATPMQTMNVYAKWIDEDSPDAGSKAVEMFSTVKPQNKTSCKTG
ncbi:MAG: tyrosine-type recombinase/integrase [Candidatus Thioglobus sp.]|nr:tyrosine-type recombinase/integrase [Candidatus Thioglobus sp.]